MSKILVTGSNGQLGREIQVIAEANPCFDFFFTDIDELDVTQKEAVERFVEKNKIDIIVNCAAYTAVDQAEEDADACRKINCDAVRIIGEVAAKYALKVVHISTDYVFDGSNHTPYKEEENTNPLGVYGESKLAGERALLSACEYSFIIRTSWLYSSFGNNFVKTMLRLGRERDTLSVVFDQIGTPTYAADLAKAIMQIILKEDAGYGIYHFSNEGVCSWYDFAKAIHRLGKIECQVLPIETRDYPTRAQRPSYSLLNKAKIKANFELTIPHWEESLSECIKLMV